MLTKKEWWVLKDKWLEENVEPIMDTFTQIDDVDFRSKTIDICPLDWGGGNVSIKYENIDTLIEELQATKQMINDYSEFSKKHLTND
jgi:hypothetical protein